MNVVVPISALKFVNHINFEPVNITQGRKFKGFAYFLGTSISQYFQNVYCKAKLWDPEQKKYVYANSDFCNGINIPAEKREADMLAFIQTDIDGIIAYAKANCRSNDENDVKKFIVNIAKKKYSTEFINAVLYSQLKITTDVAAIVEKTLQWAINLKSRPMHIYGKFCPGGKLLPMSKRIKLAYNCLAKKGITIHEDFNVAWRFNCMIFEVPERYISKYENGN